LRMMAEKHWVSDDLGGIVIGGGCGVLFPLLHKRGSLLGGSRVKIAVIAAIERGLIAEFVVRF